MAPAIGMQLAPAVSQRCHWYVKRGCRRCRSRFPVRRVSSCPDVAVPETVGAACSPAAAGGRRRRRWRLMERLACAGGVGGGDGDADGGADVGAGEGVGAGGGAADRDAVGAGGVAALPLVGERRCRACRVQRARLGGQLLADRGRARDRRRLRVRRRLRAAAMTRWRRGGGGAAGGVGAGDGDVDRGAGVGADERVAWRWWRRRSVCSWRRCCRSAATGR